MGVPRSNSPSTVSHRAVEEVKKELPEILHNESLKQQEEQQPQVAEPEIAQHEGDSPARIVLKTKLKTLLSAYNGCTKHTEVAETIAKLSKMNPSQRGFAHPDCFSGEYSTLTVPTFPGRIKTTKATKRNEEDIVQYTLGRLSFNIFQPNDLICTVRSIRNPVYPQLKAQERKDTTKAKAIFSYHFIVDLIIHTPDGDLDATLINKGFCRESDDRNNRMLVTFTGGTLIPGSESTVADNSSLNLWERTFANAYEKANRERSFLGWIYHYCLRFFLGLTLPSDFMNLGRNRYDNAFHFDMKRPPKGFFDILYMDEDMRITKGNRGTICVLERTSSKGFSQ